MENLKLCNRFRQAAHQLHIHSARPAPADLDLGPVIENKKPNDAFGDTRAAAGADPVFERVTRNFFPANVASASSEAAQTWCVRYTSCVYFSAIVV